MKWLEVHQNNVKLPESVQKKAKKFNHPPTDFLQQSSIKVDKTLFKLTITYQKTNQDDPEQSCVEISFDSKKMILVLENGKSAQLDSCVIKQEPRPLEFSRNSGYIQAIFYRVLVCMEDGNSTFIPDDSLPALKVLRVHYKAKSPNGIELTSEMDECSYVLDGDLMQVEKANTIPKVLNHQPLPVENIDYESGRNEFGKREWVFRIKPGFARTNSRKC